MSMFKETNVRENTNNNGGERQKSKFYLNIGARMPFKKDDGTVEELLIGTPYGLGLDTMTRMPGHSKLAVRKNGVLDKFTEVASKLEPGEHKVLVEDENTGICIWVQRVGEHDGSVSDEDQEALSVLKFG